MTRRWPWRGLMAVMVRGIVPGVALVVLPIWSAVAAEWQPPWSGLTWGMPVAALPARLPDARPIVPRRHVGPLIAVLSLPAESPGGVRFFPVVQVDAKTGGLRQVLLDRRGRIEPYALKRLFRVLTDRWGRPGQICHRPGIDSGDGEHRDYIWQGPVTTVHLTLYDLVTRRQGIMDPSGAATSVLEWRLPRYIVLRAHATGDRALLPDQGCPPGGPDGPGPD